MWQPMVMEVFSETGKCLSKDVEAVGEVGVDFNQLIDV
jgi:hypothetical protein